MHRPNGEAFGHDEKDKIVFELVVCLKDNIYFIA
jgi:hypothetical protein